jgi:hypothetical protein
MLQNTYHPDRLHEAPRPPLFDHLRAARPNPWLRWRPAAPQHRHVLSVAELAECTCPDLCNRDHANE